MDKYGLIGYPLRHSFSKQFFTEKFLREGIDAVYENYEIADARMLLGIVKDNPELRGLNCTIPHKRAIIPLLDNISEEAREIGAVNVIRIQRNSKGECVLEGYNHRNALILGTGGASQAIRVALTHMGINWKYVSRNPREGILCYEDITSSLIQQYEIIVNCTPVGMFPHIDEAPPLPYEALTENHLLYDLVYNPDETLFLKRGAEQGAATKNGLEMLHLQAIASWDIWNKDE